MTNKEFINILKITGKLSEQFLQSIIALGSKTLENIENYNKSIKDEFLRMEKIGLDTENILYLIDKVFIQRGIQESTKEIIYEHLELLRNTMIFEENDWLDFIDHIVEVFSENKLIENQLERLRIYRFSDIPGYHMRLRINNVQYKLMLSFKVITGDKGSKSVKRYCLYKGNKEIANDIIGVYIENKDSYKLIYDRKNLKLKADNGILII